MPAGRMPAQPWRLFPAAAFRPAAALRSLTRLLPCLLLCLALAACAPAKIRLFDDYADPLRESLIEGAGPDKILLVPVRGVISDEPGRGLFATRPSLVQETAAHLAKAARDPSVKAVVLVVDSPGGGVTASDILYHEVTRFRERGKAKVVACMMGLAASGGYYVSLAADRITAHPTTVTGSVGTIFLQPRVDGLMEKIGVEVEAFTSGDKKDMGSPFRRPTEDERALFRTLIADLNSRFLSLVSERRALFGERLALAADGRVMTANQALAAGLIDRVGYLQDALAEARSLAGLPDDAAVVAYRRTDQPDDTIYNPATSSAPTGGVKLLDLGAAEAALSLRPGFYWLWSPQIP